MYDVIDKRTSVLKELLEGERTKPELVESLPASRSTIDRAINDLEETVCIRRTGSAYTLTEVGRIAVDIHDTYLDRMNAIEESASIMKHLPPGVISADMFAPGLTIKKADPKCPLRVFQRIDTIIESSSRFRGTVPVAYGKFCESVLSASTRDDVRIELVFDEGTYENFLTNGADISKRLEQSHKIHLMKSELSDHYSVWIADHPDRTVAGLVIYNDGRVEGVLCNDHPDAIDWAVERYRSLVPAEATK